ncbi:DUF4230 domain-containing protein [Maribacter halichondriae]|uniref:DUF4230 domain-containing protein n=1 Tax=Maribacter halichondriae TaxID=2980554 RepID=UPI0023589536|nr:DUF4230 domain-containing protein [Maribacter sp. Hal144]
MDSFPLLIIGFILGAIVMYWLFSRFRNKQRKERTKEQSVILLEKIRSVCKLISVEGDFAEIYSYENTKDVFMNLFAGKKKALIIINAKTHIGYDFKKVAMRAEVDKKRIVLTHFPQPEVLSIEPHLKFYDIKNSMFNSFSSEDLTNLNKEARQHILDKIPESGLMETAKKEAMEAVLLIEKIAETIGWKLDYSGLEINEKRKEILEK